MNKQIIATILGTALLGIGNKGSKGQKSKWKKRFLDKKIHLSIDCYFRILTKEDWNSSATLENLNKLKEWFSRPDAGKEISARMIGLMEKYKNFHEVAHASLDYFQSSPDIEESRNYYIETGYGSAEDFAEEKFEEEFLDYYYAERGGYEKFLPLSRISTESNFEGFEDTQENLESYVAQSCWGGYRSDANSFKMRQTNLNYVLDILESLKPLKKIDISLPPEKNIEIEGIERKEWRLNIPLKIYVEYDFDDLATFYKLWTGDHIDIFPDIRSYGRTFSSLELKYLIGFCFSFLVAEVMYELKIDPYKLGYAPFALNGKQGEFKFNFDVRLDPTLNSITGYPDPKNPFGIKKSKLRKR